MSPLAMSPACHVGCGGVVQQAHQKTRLKIRPAGHFWQSPAEFTDLSRVDPQHTGPRHRRQLGGRTLRPLELGSARSLSRPPTSALASRPRSSVDLRLRDRLFPKLVPPRSLPGGIGVGRYYSLSTSTQARVPWLWWRGVDEKGCSTRGAGGDRDRECGEGAGAAGVHISKEAKAVADGDCRRSLARKNVTGARDRWRLGCTGWAAAVCVAERRVGAQRAPGAERARCGLVRCRHSVGACGR